MNQQQVTELLHQKFKASGLTQAEFSRKYLDLGQPSLAQFLGGQKPSKRVLDYLGLERIETITVEYKEK